MHCKQKSNNVDMSAYEYYDDLSGGESSIDANDNSDLDEYLSLTGMGYTRSLQPSAKEISGNVSSKLKNSIASSFCQYYMDSDNKNNNKNILDDKRIVLHLDVDCFYCQCECIDRGLDPNQPLAIGQKHIIVTCNYAARNKLGLSKLSSRQHAKERYPDLLIVDGSDLERYRKHGRALYECFRNTIKKINPNCAVCKGSMDEMMADMTPLVENDLSCNITEGDSTELVVDDDIYIYGEQDETTIVTEDQSGVASKVVNRLESKHVDKISSNEMHAMKRLKMVAKYALKIRQCILAETGFTTTLGLSVNPLAAKLASGLRKPWNVNILLPNSKAVQLINSMPLRKIPGIGHRTMKLLKECMVSFYDGDVYTTSINESKKVSSRVWTCGDLTQLPRKLVVDCLSKVSSIKDSNVETKCDILLEKCRGIDETIIVDDGGALSKTLSVEDSYRRGTVTTKDQVKTLAEILFTRLVRLFRDRMLSNTLKSQFEYPTVIKLTIRNVLQNVALHTTNQKSSQLKSQQIPFNGMKLASENDNQKQILYLRNSIYPMLYSLVFTANKSFNITRMNIALSNFVVTRNFASPNGTTGSTFFVSNGPSSSDKRKLPNMNTCNQSNATVRRNKSIDESCVISSPRNHVSTHRSNNFFNYCHPDEIDQDVLSQLPPEIAKEVIQSMTIVEQQSNMVLTTTNNKKIVQPKNKRLKTLNDFFRPSSTIEKK